MVQRVNKEHFLCVTVPGTEQKVLLTPTGELPGGNYLDPAGKQQLVISHAEQKCTGVAPLSTEMEAEMSAAESLRSSVDAAMNSYKADKLPDAVVTTYGQKSGGTCTVTCCIGICTMSAANYWAGLWRSEWKLVATDGASSGALTGRVQCNVHYFEDGNVQLDDTKTFSCSVPLSADVGAAFRKAVATHEASAMASVEEIYQHMSDSVLAGLRRRLPVTKMKFDWENKAAVHNLAKDLNTLKAGK